MERLWIQLREEKHTNLRERMTLFENLGTVESANCHILILCCIYLSRKICKEVDSPRHLVQCQWVSPPWWESQIVAELLVFPPCHLSYLLVCPFCLLLLSLFLFLYLSYFFLFQHLFGLAGGPRDIAIRGCNDHKVPTLCTHLA